MKFEYEEDNKDKEVVAYITNRGHLYIRCDEGIVGMLTDGQIANYNELDFDSEMPKDSVVKRFYKGDKITITF